MLWAQAEILQAGIASGTIVVQQAKTTTSDAPAYDIDPFELHFLIQLYEAYLNTTILPRSNPLQDHYESRSGSLSGVIFTESLQAAVTSLMWTPPASAVDNDPAMPTPLSATRSLLLDMLERTLELRRAGTATLILDSICASGLSISEPLEPEVKDPIYIYSLPTLADLSESIDVLVVAVEHCLQDRSLSVQEAGLLLCIRRCSPSRATTEYAVKRLGAALLSWMVVDSELLAVVQSGSLGRDQGGAALLKARQLLTITYLQPWFKALRRSYGESDVNAYGCTLFDCLLQVATGSTTAIGTDDAVSSTSSSYM